MKNNLLTSSDIMDLITDYKSEVRKLEAKTAFCESRIAELESMLKNPESSQKNSEPQKPVKPTFTTSTGVRPRKKETKPRKPYPISQWDEIILNVIKENGKATLSKDIYDLSFAKAKELGIFSDKEKSKSKINQCLVKLANRRGDVVKIKYGGRGFAYCFPDWIDDKGKLKKDYAIVK